MKKKMMALFLSIHSEDGMFPQAEIISMFQNFSIFLSIC